jgi:hypothetical protein
MADRAVAVKNRKLRSAEAAECYDVLMLSKILTQC